MMWHLNRSIATLNATSQLLDIYRYFKKNHKEKNDLKRKKKEYTNQKQFVGIMLIFSFFWKQVRGFMEVEVKIVESLED